jgi:hypothetical protein
MYSGQWTKKLNKRIKAIRFSLLWLELTVFFGLMQVWLVVLASNFLQEAQVNLLDMMLDGVLLFFSIAIIASVTVDYILDNYCLLEQTSCQYGQKMDKKLLWILLLSIVPIFISVFLYGVSYANKTNIHEHMYIAYYTGLFIYTLFFAFAIKLHDYYIV